MGGNGKMQRKQNPQRSIEYEAEHEQRLAQAQAV